MIPVAQDRYEVTFQKRTITNSTLIREYRCRICGGRLTIKRIDDTYLVRCGAGDCPPDFVHENQIAQEKAMGDEVIDGLPPELQELYRTPQKPRQEEDNTGMICKVCATDKRIKTGECAFPGICPECDENHILFQRKGEDHAN